MGVSKLKKDADKVFSLWVRRKDLDSDGLATCVTCGVKGEWKYMDAGHYVPRNWLKLRYDERNVHVQCKGCNVFKKGNMDEYARFMVREYGRGILNKLAKEKVPHQMKAYQYQEIIDKYADLNVGLDIRGENG